LKTAASVAPAAEVCNYFNYKGFALEHQPRRLPSERWRKGGVRNRPTWLQSRGSAWHSTGTGKPDFAFVLALNARAARPPSGISCIFYQSDVEHSGQSTRDYLEAGPETWRVRIGKTASV